MERTVRQQNALSHTEISTFCSQIAMVLRAGISLQEGISILIGDAKNQQGAEIYSKILMELELGAPFYFALQKAECFPRYLLNMTEIGERTGRLDQVMDSLADYYKREEQIKNSLRSAVSYPLVMIVMMMVVIAVLIVKVLPIFDAVFAQLGGEMNAMSRALLSFGESMERYSWLFVGVLALLGGVFLATLWSASIRTSVMRVVSRLPGVASLYATIASGRFASAMSMTIASGMELDESLEMVYQLVDNRFLQDKIRICQREIDKGSTFSDALLQAEIFSGIHARMVSVGFKTGAMDRVMQDLADRHEEQANAQIATIISIIEPTLVAILSIIVGMILLSVMLPLLGIMSSIG